MKTGQAILDEMRRHLGEEYVFGAMTPVGAYAGKGPWDCSKRASAAVFGASGIIYGCENNHADPMHCYGGTIYWHRDAQAQGIKISVELAAGIPGAAVLRFVEGEACHHIVISDGRGGTVEAACARYGVIAGTLHGRRWSTGILVPGIDYGPVQIAQPVQPPPGLVYRLGRITGPMVVRIQLRLQNLCYLPETSQADGIFGPETQAAVLAFQRAQGGLVADGEVGPLTFKALGMDI